MTITAHLLGQALIAAGNVLLGAPSSIGNAVNHQTHAVGAVTSPQIDTLGAVTQPAAVTYPDRTEEQLTALIQPHVGNEAIKAALGVAMRSLNIQAFPETQPHQRGHLYALFEGVLKAHGVGAAQPAAATSII